MKRHIVNILAAVIIVTMVFYSNSQKIEAEKAEQLIIVQTLLVERLTEVATEARDEAQLAQTRAQTAMRQAEIARTAELIARDSLKNCK